MSEDKSNANVEQEPGSKEPQAPRCIPVEKVDDGNHPLNNPPVEKVRSIFN